MSVPQAASSSCVNHPGVSTERLCDRCLRPHCADCLVALQGQSVCAGCKHTLLSAGFRSYTVMVPTRAPATPAPSPVLPAGPPLESACALHEHQPAVAVCDRCGDFICLLCLTPFEGRGYCLRCFELLWGRGELGRHTYTWRAWENPTTASVLGVVAWLLVFLPLVTFLPAIGAILVAAAGLRKIKLEPGRSGRQTAVAVIVAATLAIIASVVFTIAFYV